MNWKDSITSEVNDLFVSNPYPTLNETISIKIRLLKNNEVENVYLKTRINGANHIVKMNKSEDNGLFSYYSVEIQLNQPQISYCFIFQTFNKDYFFYTRKSVTSFHPTDDHNFVIIANFENPGWIPGSVFYQIFPDRFYNGNPDLSVKNNEYIFDGKPTIQMKWDEIPLEYPDGHCLDFFGGDLYGIKEKIPYLKELGVNAIYVTPIFEAKTVHKYDCTDYFHVDKHLGGDEALIELTNELHKNNMKLIVDVSLNHTGVEHKWFKKALSDKNSEEREYYYIDENNNYVSWFGFHTLPKLNYTSDKLHKVIYKDDNSLVKHYLREPFNIDGWRFDVGNHFANHQKDQLGHDIFKEIRKSIKSTRKDAFIVGEHWEDNLSFLSGNEWDSSMNYFSSSRPLKGFLGAVDRFLRDLDDEQRKTTPTSGTNLSEQIMQHLARIPNQLMFLQFNLIDSHDVYRLHTNKNCFDFNIYRGLLIILYLLPGTVCIYYGDEIGLTGTTSSDEGIRYPMQWDKNKWDMNFYKLYQKLSHLKLKEKALHTGNYKILYADDDTFVLARFNFEKVYIGVLTRNDQNKIINIPVSLVNVTNGIQAKEIFNNNVKTIEGGSFQIALNRKESLLYEIKLK